MKNADNTNKKQKDTTVYVFLTCVNPGVIFKLSKIQLNNKVNYVCKREYAVNRDFFEIVEALDFSNTQDVYVCAGPGSYTGIRQTLSFGVGLSVKDTYNIHVFNLFDFIKTLTGYEDIIINGFSKKPFSRGFALIDNEYTYVNLTESEIEKLKNENKTYLADDVSSLFTCNNVTKFIQEFTGFSADIKPLYINPVNITKSKAK